MSPTRIATLGPELLPLARGHTNDLSQAHFLVHQVVSRLSREPRISDDIGVNEAQSLMSELAREHGIMGRTTA